MLDITKLGVSSFCTSFLGDTVGTKVTDRETFMVFAKILVEKTDFVSQECPGQASIPSNVFIPYVSAGVGVRTKNPNDYKPRFYRGQMELFLKREFAILAESCSIIVYTRAAYLADPQVMSDPEEVAKVEQTDFTHFLVTVIAAAGPRSPVSPHRFVQNLAGGNNQAKAWDGDRIRAEALKIKEYHDVFCTVAD